MFVVKLASILAQVHKATRAGTLVASVNHPEDLKLHLRLHPSRSLPRVAHCAADSSGVHFLKRCQTCRKLIHFSLSTKTHSQRLYRWWSIAKLRDVVSKSEDPKLAEPQVRQKSLPHFKIQHHKLASHHSPQRGPGDRIRDV